MDQRRGGKLDNSAHARVILIEYATKGRVPEVSKFLAEFWRGVGCLVDSTGYTEKEVVELVLSGEPIVKLMRNPQLRIKTLARLWSIEADIRSLET